MRFYFTLLISVFLLFSSSCSAQKTSAENITKIARLEKARAAHTATRLADGHVLIAGGMQQNGVFYDEVEIFDPHKNSFTKLETKMTTNRVSHTATLLEDGRVLIVGGWSNRVAPENSAEVYDPTTKQFTALQPMKFRRSGHTATLLENGKVLIAGGNSGDEILSEAELFDPDANAFETIDSMESPRGIHTATLLKSGAVLLTGGEFRQNSVVSSVEIFDPKTSSFRKLSEELSTKRYKHDAVLLGDGRVLIFGGSDERDTRGKLKSAELFDPELESFTKTNDMKTPRFKIGKTAVLLKNGKVLIAGGGEKAEIFDPKTNEFSLVLGSLDKSLHYASVTLLDDGRALIIGGYEFIQGGSPTSTDQAWIFANISLQP